MEKKTDWGELMKLSQAGDKMAYQQLLSEISPAIRTFLAASRLPKELIDEVVQESLMAVHAARHTYEVGKPFRSWLFAIIRNKKVDLIRRRIREYKKLEAVQLDFKQNTQSLKSETNIELELKQILSLLPEDQRKAIELVKLSGLSLDEAASKLGVSPSTLKVRVHRGIQKLKTLMEQENCDAA